MLSKFNWDALGISTSLLCAIHCAVLPLIITSLPIMGINIVNNMEFEFFMIFLASGIGAYALFHGYQKHHFSKLPLLIFSAGILLLLAKQLWHDLELWFLVPAVAFIVTAHYLNFRLLRLAQRGRTKHHPIS